MLWLCFVASPARTEVVTRSGVLRRVLARTVAEPVAPEWTTTQAMLPSSPVDLTLSAADKRVFDESQPLAAYWSRMGFPHYHGEGKGVSQVVVEHAHNTMLVYPADQVYREAAFLAVPRREQRLVPWSYQHRINMRHVFVAKPGCVLLSTDYSQVLQRCCCVGGLRCAHLASLFPSTCHWLPG